MEAIYFSERFDFFCWRDLEGVVCARSVSGLRSYSVRQRACQDSRLI